MAARKNSGATLTPKAGKPAAKQPASQPAKQQAQASNQPVQSTSQPASQPTSQPTQVDEALLQQTQDNRIAAMQAAEQARHKAMEVKAEIRATRGATAGTRQPRTPRGPRVPLVPTNLDEVIAVQAAKPIKWMPIVLVRRTAERVAMGQAPEQAYAEVCAFYGSMVQQALDRVVAGEEAEYVVEEQQGWYTHKRTQQRPPEVDEKLRAGHATTKGSTGSTNSAPTFLPKITQTTLEQQVAAAEQATGISGSAVDSIGAELVASGATVVLDDDDDEETDDETPAADQEADEVDDEADEEDEDEDEEADYDDGYATSDDEEEDDEDEEDDE